MLLGEVELAANLAHVVQWCQELGRRRQIRVLVNLPLDIGVGKALEFLGVELPFRRGRLVEGLSDGRQTLSFERAGRAEMTRCLSPRRVYTTVMNRPSTCPVTTIRLSPHGRGSTNYRTGPLKICAGGGRLRHLGVKIDVYGLSEDGEVS